MHIALIADNVADRKQAERLLDRANSALSENTGTLFVDSYGNEVSFLPTCMQYELIILDFDQNPENTAFIIQKLKEKNSPALISVCKREEDSFNDTDIDYVLEKPLKVAQLHDMLIQAHERISKYQKMLNLLEIRTDEDTYHFPRPSLVYARYHDKQDKITYHFEDGNILTCRGNFEDLKRSLILYDEFELRPYYIIVNIHHVVSETKKSVTLDNGDTLTYPLMHILLPRE